MSLKCISSCLGIPSHAIGILNKKQNAKTKKRRLESVHRCYFLLFYSLKWKMKRLLKTPPDPDAFVLVTYHDIMIWLGLFASDFAWQMMAWDFSISYTSEHEQSVFGFQHATGRHWHSTFNDSAIQGFYLSILDICTILCTTRGLEIIR